MTSRIVIVLTAVVLSTFIASDARAESRVIVHDFYGPSATRMRDDVVNLLERQEGVTIISKSQIEAAAKKLNVDPYSPEGRQALSRDLKLSAWMTGMVQKRGGKLKLTLVVYDGAQHARVGRAQLSGRNATQLSSEIRSRLWQRSGRAITNASAPDLSATPEPTEVASRADMVVTAQESQRSRLRDRAESKGSSSESTISKGEAVRAFIGIGSPYRSLAYNEPITSSLGDYQLSGTPMADLNVSFHPARFLTDGWLSWLGLDAGASIALTTPSVDRNGTRFKSRYDAFHVGLRARIPLGAHYVSAFSGYAMNRFSITAPSKDVSTPTPSVDYRTIRSGAGAEFAFTDELMVGLDAAWLNFLSVGDIGGWFPRATGAGLEVGVFGTYAMTDDIFMRAAATYQRNFFDFNSRPGDKNVAGGATDQYLALSLGAGVKL